MRLKIKHLGYRLVHWFLKKDSSPHKGDPNKHTPSRGRRMVWGGSWNELSPSGQKTSHLCGLRWKPCWGPCKTTWKNLETEERGPMIVPSSKYQTCNRRSSGTLISFCRLERARENKRGPRGSPCWTPQDDKIQHGAQMVGGNRFVPMLVRSLCLDAGNYRFSAIRRMTTRDTWLGK